MTSADRDRVTIVGEEALAWFRPSGGAERGFCTRCGSSLFWTAPGRGTMSIAAGTLDNPQALRVVAHIWCEHAADYDTDHPDGVEHHPRGAPPRLSATPRS